MNRLENAILAARDEQRLGFLARVEITDEMIRIDTRISRNPAKSNNGGDYFYHEEFWPSGGQILWQEFCSCDFWQPMDEPEAVGEEDGWDAFKARVLSLETEHGLKEHL